MDFFIIIVLSFFLLILYIETIYYERYIQHSLFPIFTESSSYIIRKNKASLLPLRSSLYINKSIPLPTFFMYKLEYLSPIIDQGKCGSCWVFSALNVLSDRASILSNGTLLPQLSAQQILSCIPDGCNGGSPEDIYDWMIKNKVETSIENPYKQTNYEDIKTPCKKIEKGYNVINDSIVSLTEFIKEDNYDKNILEKNIKNMKLELVSNGPFTGTITIYKSFYNFSGNGVFKTDKKTRGNNLGGHAIEIIGFCDPGIDKRKGFNEGYWICKHSWSYKWPTKTNDKGYFAIVMGSNNCGIESRCCRADLEIQISETTSYKELLAYNNYKNFIKNKSNNRSSFK